MEQPAQGVPGPDSESDKSGKELTLLGHLQELRWRLIRSLVFIAVATVVSFFFADEVFEILKSRVDDLDLIYVEVTELLGVYMRVSLLGGVVLSIPLPFLGQFIWLRRSRLLGDPVAHSGP